MHEVLDSNIIATNVKKKKKKKLFIYYIFWGAKKDDAINSNAW